MKIEIKGRSNLRGIIVSACLWVMVGALHTPSVMAGETLARVRSNGKIRCGVTERLLGFSYQEKSGRWQGFNVDFCRAIASAVFGNPDKVSFIPLSAPNRFPVLLSRKIDILAHTATWTFGREAGIGVQFPAIYFYDGQTFMAPAKKKLKKLEDLKGATICVEKGTTFQLNMADVFQVKKIPYTPMVFDSFEEVGKAFLAGKCEACTAERSVLSALRAEAPGGEKGFTIMRGEISKEPLGPAVRCGDDEWITLVRWVLFALIEAEERGITSKNVRQIQKTTTDTEILRFLNTSGNLGKSLGLKSDWVARVIEQVGNYGEIFERNFGKASGLNVERGMNRLWNKGGLLYAPPFQ